jgi:hypothetical protein
MNTGKQSEKQDSELNHSFACRLLEAAVVSEVSWKYFKIPFMSSAD